VAEPTNDTTTVDVPRPLKDVPPGHFPKKAGECRLWFAGTPPGQQPKAVACTTLIGEEKVPAGAFILHVGKVWDSRYDWVAHAERDTESVPEIIVQIIESMR
jgi:hypothetical protein